MLHRNGFCSNAGRSRLSSKGFTLIEFVVALVFLAVAVSMAVPTLRQFSANNQLIAANNSIVTGLNLARSTAITTGDDITICPSVNGTTCSEDNWDAGWIVFNDANGDGSAATAEVIRVVTIESDVTNSGFGDNIVFQADGTTELGSNATITNCREQGATGQNCANVTINQFGLIESEKQRTGSEETPIDEPTS